MTPQWKNSRQLKERVVITGILVLEAPTHLGNGDTDSPLDMPLLIDAREGKAMLPGTSLAGALRQSLNPKEADALFGHVSGGTSVESYLLIDDALADSFERELRDGVAIDPKTRTAEENKKFDIELLSAGVQFSLSFELLVPRKNGDKLIRSLATALIRLERGEIRLGKRKRRGFGKCRVTSWKVCRYSMTDIKGLRAWLNYEENDCVEGTSIADLLGINVKSLPTRAGFHMKAVFALDGSLLIRSGFGKPNSPDVVHLHSRRDGQDTPILSGTSLAGVLRARALRIANTVHGKGAGEKWTDRIFGNRNIGNQRKELTASRLWVEETVIERPLELVQTRVKIDRFTGGSFPAALFSEQPVWGRTKEDTLVTVELYLEPPRDEDISIDPEIGLLLLLLKDLWTGDLPLGGESSIGRGRLRGIQAELKYDDSHWKIKAQENGALTIEGNRKRLESFVQAFVSGGHHG